MTMGLIRVLKPNVTQHEALCAFSATGFSSLYWRIRSGPLRRIAEVYVPYFLFRVKCGNARPRLFAMDAVDGSLDLFEFPRIPEEGAFQAAPDRNRLKAALSEEQAAALLREKALRIIFQQGFFQLRNAHLEISFVPGELHLPYWLGFYGREGSVRCRVMDAVRRRIEGAKASTFFEHWLAA
ncbi:MAG TPA: hypothetical protein VKB90_04645 [Candidatus Acidoferrum sp.]|nr:hypothetical protein [Candidatus Acidoferrum sp.]